MIFSATEGAFEGFRLTRHHPLGVLSWAVVMLVANLAVGLAIGGIAGPQWMEFEQLAGSATPDAAQMSALMPKVLPAALISMLIQVGAAAVVNTSVLRALLRPEGRVTIGFGRDELRVIGLLLAFFVVSFVATLVLGVALGLLGPLVGTALVVFLSPLLGGAVTVVLFIRFSLAGPMTIAEHRFHFRDSWKATRGFFWPLVGSELLGASLAMVVVMLAHIIFVAVAGIVLIASGGSFADLGGMFSPDFSTPEALARPLPLIYVAFLSVLYAIALAILNGPPIELYRSLRRAGKLDGPPLP
jgi:hypothetical protein